MRRAGRIAAIALCFVGGTIALDPPQEVLGEKNAHEAPQTSWKLGELIPVECLNRTVETGEHVCPHSQRLCIVSLEERLIIQITDARGELQYIPFPVCNETGRPLELVFGSETDINCTIESISDPLFHLFEFYIHNDAPLSCRLPSLPPAPASPSSSPTYTHLQIALSGTWQLSHLHINPQLNVIVHTTASAPADDAEELLTASSRSKNKRKKKKKPMPLPSDGLISEGALLAAAAYSLPPSTESAPRIVIGDPLPLVLTVRWFSERTLPPSTARLAGKQTGLGGHVHVSTVLYCLLSFGGGVALSLAYWRGIELPRRLRYYGAEKLGMSGMGFEGGRGGYAFPGKRD